MRRPLLAQLNPVWLDSFIIEIINFFVFHLLSLLFLAAECKFQTREEKRAELRAARPGGNEKGIGMSLLLLLTTIF